MASTQFFRALDPRRLDPLIILIISAVIVAIILPARGEFAQSFAVAVNWAIALLFFLYGARLSPQEALAGLKNYRLHLLILALTFIAYPIIGLALRPLTAVISHDMYLGILFLTLVPSTVQSSVAFTSVARGNIAGAIVAASASNLVGVVATPLLALVLMNTGGITIDASVFREIAVLLLLPFVLGQCARVIPAVKSTAAKKATKIVDRGSITMVVYSAFSAGMVAGVWQSIAVSEIIFLIGFSLALVSFMLWLSRRLAQWAGFSYPDQVTIQLCGTQKSLATGLPMATVIFGGASLGLLILPLMIYHQIQLMVCSWLVSRYAKNYEHN